MIPKPTFKPLSLRKGSWLVFAGVLFVGAVFTWYLHSLGMILVLVDQFSHIAIARQIVDSLTPGLSQLGFWPPLLHILLAPFAQFDGLYESGLAAAMVLVPLLALGCVCFFRTLNMLGVSSSIALGAVLIVLVNPYTLYYAATPMTEVLLLSLLFIATWALTRWYFHPTLPRLILAGVIIAAVTLARFEGFILIPVAGLIVLYRLMREKKSWHEIEATAQTFGLLAIAGVVFILVYGLVYAGDALAFMNNAWGAYAQQRDYLLPTEGDLGVALLYFFEAARIVLGPLVLALALIVAPFALLLSDRRAPVLACLSLLAAPFIFDIFALYQGSAIINVPHLPPFENFYFNERYALLAIGFVAAVFAFLAQGLQTRLTTRPALWPVGVFAAALVMFTGVNMQAQLLSTAACADCFEVIALQRQNSPKAHGELADELRERYDHGMILMTRALHNEVAVRAGIPLDHYIVEANQYYYDEALAHPWYFARWVVMFNPDAPVYTSWFLQNERVSYEWAYAHEFHHYYDRVFETANGDEWLYRLNEEKLRAFLAEHEISPSLVPSLEQNPQPWKDDDVFARIKAQLPEHYEFATTTGQLHAAFTGDGRRARVAATGETSIND